MFPEQLELVIRFLVYLYGFTTFFSSTRIFLESVFWAPRNGSPIDVGIFFVAYIVAVTGLLVLHRAMERYVRRR